MANLHLSYEEFKYFYGDLGITYWTKYNYLDMDYVGKYNVWDEEIESGRINYNNGALVTDNAYFRTKNYIKVIPNKSYHFKIGIYENPTYAKIIYYDEDYNYVDYYDFTNRNLTMPSNVYYIKFCVYGNAYNNDIRIYQYVLNLDRVDLEALNWSYNTGDSFKCWYTNDLTSLAKFPSSNNVKGNFLATNYDTLTLSSFLDGSTPGLATSNSASATKSVFVRNGSSTEKPIGFLVYEKI